MRRGRRSRVAYPPVYTCFIRLLQERAQGRGMYSRVLDLPGGLVRVF
jgi:hypothetical protein